jgi:hypothetical protein
MTWLRHVTYALANNTVMIVLRKDKDLGPGEVLVKDEVGE